MRRRVSLAAIDGGTFYHHHSLHEPPFDRFFDALIYAPELGRHDLAAHDALIVTCRTPPHLIAPHASAIRRYLDAGGTVVAMGETGSERWLPAVRWTDSELNFWWWLEPGADSGVRVADPGHDLWRFLEPRDVVWHHHGFFAPPPGACSIVDAAGQGSILYEDRATTPGRMIVTSLDPFYHHGSHFMPAATRFLRGFLPWLRWSLGERDAASSAQNAQNAVRVGHGRRGP